MSNQNPLLKETDGSRSCHPKQWVEQPGLYRSWATGAEWGFLEKTPCELVLSSCPPVRSWLFKKRGIPTITSVQTRNRKPNCKDTRNQYQTLSFVCSDINIHWIKPPSLAVIGRAVNIPRAMWEVNRARCLESRTWFSGIPYCFRNNLWTCGSRALLN